MGRMREYLLAVNKLHASDDGFLVLHNEIVVTWWKYLPQSGNDVVRSGQIPHLE